MPAVAQTSVTATTSGRGRVRVQLEDGPIQRLRLDMALEGVDMVVHFSPSQAHELLVDISRALEDVRAVDRVA